MIVINLISIVFLILILLQLCKTMNTNIIEGNKNKTDETTYKDNNLSDDPLYLATLNASNIQFLKNNIDEVSDLRNLIIDLSNSVQTNTTNITNMNQAQMESSAAATGIDAGDEDDIDSTINPDDDGDY